MNLNQDDFLSNIENSTKGCFNIQTNESKDGKSVVGFAELTAMAGNYGMIMQSEFNLSKDASDSNANYFLNKFSFLKKETDKTWKLNKVVAWKEEAKIKGKKYDDIVDSPKERVGFWKKGEKGEDYLFSKFNFKADTTFWRENNSSNFSFSNIIFSYSSGKWYKDKPQTINFSNNAEWYSKIPKGKWTIIDWK